jgi:hypothetical protein
MNIDFTDEVAWVHDQVEKTSGTFRMIALFVFWFMCWPVTLAEIVCYVMRNGWNLTMSEIRTELMGDRG